VKKLTIGLEAGVCNYSAPAVERSIVMMSLSVCLSVGLYMSISEHISGTECPNFTKFSVHVACSGTGIHCIPPL